jgi:gamma-glutamylcyclotransferase (GGCT)/AIG2-like uncharacterized protein YtfP
MKQYLWAYGTLRRGESNHHFLTGCAFLGMVCYPGRLFSVESQYPVFQPDSTQGQTQGSKVVIGELYEIKSELWPRLDELEGIEEGYYQRVSLPIGPEIIPREAQVIVYIVGPLLASYCREEHLIANGDWCQRSSFSL